MNKVLQLIAIIISVNLTMPIHASHNTNNDHQKQQLAKIKNYIAKYHGNNEKQLEIVRHIKKQVLEQTGDSKIAKKVYKQAYRYTDGYKLYHASSQRKQYMKAYHADYERAEKYINYRKSKNKHKPENPHAVNDFQVNHAIFDESAILN